MFYIIDTKDFSRLRFHLWYSGIPQSQDRPNRAWNRTFQPVIEEVKAGGPSAPVLMDNRHLVVGTLYALVQIEASDSPGSST